MTGRELLASAFLVGVALATWAALEVLVRFELARWRRLRRRRLELEPREQRVQLREDQLRSLEFEAMRERSRSPEQRRGDAGDDA